MFRRAAILLAITLLLGVFTARAQNDKDDTIKVETRLVSVPTVVSDRNGRYVPNLTQADFTVFQDGAQQQIEFFAATEEPITIALLIDTSHSTQEVLGDIKDSAKSFIKLLKPADRAMIVTFDFETLILSPLTNDQERLKQAIKRAEIPRPVGTTLNDAVYQTIFQSFKGINGRKAIIVLTDGKDSGSRMSRSGLLYHLQESDTLIYSVMFQTEDRVGRGATIFGFPFPRGDDRMRQRREERLKQINADARGFLQELSETTAGRFFSSKDGKMKKTFEAIVEELRFQYRIGFYPPEEGGDAKLHTLRVKVARPDTVVRARSSYRAN